MISYVEKDKVLSFICHENYTPGRSFTIDGTQFRSETGLKNDVIISILDYFKGKGLIAEGYGTCSCAVFQIITKVEAHDLFLHGGFFAQEELLKKNIEKLLLEIESLKPSLPDRVERITSIAANIATAISLFIK